VHDIYCLFQADVIYCSPEKDLSLSKGAVSKTLSDAAGPGLQGECQSKYPRGINYGDVVRTGGHKLQCKYVYHGVCPRWDAVGGRTQKVLASLILPCFQLKRNISLNVSRICVVWKVNSKM
jgi:O-acetyl-ADP-ribose deacetylase (regulator of RNase III)